MIVNCSASKTTLANWASLSFGYLDADYQPLDTVEAEIPETRLSNVSATLQAPANTAFAEVLVYAENGAEIDHCELISIPGTATAILANSDFEDDLQGWQTCSQGTVTAENAVATINNSCISQQFTASEGLALELTCDGHKADSDHAAVVLGYLDRNFQGIDLREASISTEEGLFPSVSLTAPASTVYVEAMVYALGEADINSCTLQQQQPSAE